MRQPFSRDPQEYRRRRSFGDGLSRIKLEAVGCTCCRRGRGGRREEGGGERGGRGEGGRKRGEEGAGGGEKRERGGGRGRRGREGFGLNLREAFSRKCFKTLRRCVARLVQESPETSHKFFNCDSIYGLARHGQIDLENHSRL